MSEHGKATPRPWYHETLEEIEDYFDQRADADHNGVSYTADKEMLCLQAVRAVKQQLTRCDASRALIEQMRDALRSVDPNSNWQDVVKVSEALAAAEKFLEGQ